MTNVPDDDQDETADDQLVRGTNLGELPFQFSVAFSAADSAVLALAVERGAMAVMDDGYGRDIANVEGIETRGPASLVFSLVQDDELEAEDARETLEAMLNAGWHCSLSLYSKLLSTLEEIA